MSDTIWVRRKSRVGTDDSGDDYDHSLFCKNSEALDELATSLGVRKPSDFFDTTDVEYNMSEDDLPESWITENEKWYPPSEALPALHKLIEHLRAGEAKGIQKKIQPELLEELEDCAAKLGAAESEGDLFHFCIVM